jgi:hypothetical protein
MNEPVYIDAELQAWIDPLAPDELARLEASLIADGCRDPLVVWGGYLLDGHNRYTLCTKHGIPFQTVEKTGLVTKEDAKIWMIENQLGRRNTTDFSRVALALKLKPLVAERAKARMLAGKADPSLNLPEGPTRTDEAIAKAAGVGRDTVRKVEKIIEKASAEVIAQVRTGEMSINAATKTITPPKPPKAKPSIPSNSGELDGGTDPTVATPRLTPEQGAVAVIDVAALQQENAALRQQLAERDEQLADFKADVAELLAENEQMGRVVEADDQLKAAMAEVARFKALLENAERTLSARSHEFNERARLVTYWTRRAEKAEKLLGKAA